MSGGASRDKTQADYDLERIVDVLDEAIMSQDPRVQECLRRLMVTVALISPETSAKRTIDGPFRQMRSDMRDIHSRLSRIEDDHVRNKQTQGPTVEQWRQMYQPTWTTGTPDSNVKPWTAGDPPNYGVFTAIGTGTAPEVAPIFKGTTE
jgi:hypothetical protein